MFHSPPRRRMLFALLTMLAIGLAAIFALRSPLVTLAAPSTNSGQAVLAAWEKARSSGSYHFQSDVTQLTIPTNKLTNVGRSSRTEQLHLEGENDLLQNAMELRLWSNGGNVQQVEESVGVQMRNGKTLVRRGTGEWQERTDLSLDTIAPQGDFMSYLVAMRNVQTHPPESRNGIRFTRYSFTIDGPTFALHLHKQMEAAMRAKGELPPGVKLEIPRYYQKMTGEGELWIGEDGLPLRQVMTLQFPEQKEETVNAQIVVDFSKFGTPEVAPLTLLRTGNWSGLWASFSETAASLPASLLPFFLAMTMLCGVVWIVRQRRARALQSALVVAVIASMVFAPILNTLTTVRFLDVQSAKAAAHDEQQATIDQEQAVRDALGTVEFNPHVNPLESSDLRLGDWEISDQSPNLLISQSPAAVLPVDSTLDTDKDGLSDFVEERVGTSLVISDTDGDGLRDNLEVLGFNHSGKKWYLNPDAADSNGDGQGDLLEWGINANGVPQPTPQDTDGDTKPDLFDFDNDNDGVPDNKDMSPYRVIKAATGGIAYFGEAAPFKLTVNNLTPNTPVLVDFQIRPKDAKHLAFAYNVLDWPQDAEGQVRDIDGATYADLGGASGSNGANGDLKLTPVLEIRINGSTTNLPPQNILTAYNLTLNNYTADGATKLVYVPLSIINDESTGQRVAFNGRMRYNAAGSWPSPHDVRLAWVVQGLVDFPCDPADAEDVAQGCQPDGYIHNVQQVLNSYYDDFSLTGLSVREDRGASQAIIYEDPAVDSDKQDDFPLWALSDGINERFLGGVIDLNEVVRRFNRTTNSAVSITERWSIPNTLRVEQKNYTSFDEAVVTTAMTETKRILDSQFASSWQANNSLKPLLLFASEQRFRAQSLDSVASPVSPALTLDFAPGGQALEVQTLASFKATPYCSTDGANPIWDACDADAYWVELEQRHLNAAALPGDTDPDLKLGRMFAAEIYFLSLLNGASTVTKVGTRSVSALYSLKTDAQLETDYRTYLSLGLRTGVPAIANQIVMAFVTGGDTTTAKLLSSGWKSLQRIGLGIPSAKAEFAKFGQAAKNAFKNITRVKVGIAVGVTLAVSALVTGLIVGLPENGLGAQIVVKILAIGVTTALSVVLPILDVVEVVGMLSAGGATGAAAKVLSMSSELVGSSRTAGAIGAVLGVGLTWGFFIYSMVSNNVSAFSAEFNKALAEAIAATIYILVVTLISSTVIGTILVAIIAVIDAILTAVCELGVEDLRTVPGMGGACFTLGNGAIKVIAYLIYNYDQMIDTERKDLVVMGSPKIALADPNKGFIQGNGISVSMPVTTTIVHKSPDASNGLIINVYLYLFSPDNLRSTSFKYALTQSESPFVIGRDAMTNAWQNVGVDHYYEATPMYRGQAVANPIPQVTGIVRTAGLNRTTDFFFNTYYAIPAYECWMMPFPFIPFVPPIPVCYTRTLSGSNSTKIDVLKFDIFPATLDGFMAMGSKADGGLGLSWDAAFPSLSDADGDGLLALNRNGIDPNDNSWDADNDGLSDSYELERRQAGVNYSLTLRDTDGDGLTDLQEAQLDTNPAKADTDGDGLKDSEEVWHERIDPATGAATGIWEGGWDITINATTPFVLRISSNPTLKDTDNDGLDDLAERVLALDPVAANRIDLDNRPYSPIIVNSPPIVITGESNDLDRFLAPNQSFIYTSTVVALRKVNPGTLNLTVPSVLGAPSPASPYALAFNPLTFNTAQTLTVQTNLKVIANPVSQVANLSSRAQTTLNPSNGGVSATGSYTVVVDNDKPVVQLTSLKNGGYVRAFNRTFYVIGGTATDATSYPALVRVTAQDGLGTRDASGAASWSATVGINPGTNLIKLYARDAVGNEYTTPTDVIIYGDGVAPAGQIVSADGNYTTTRNSAGQWVVKINGTISDPTSTFTVNPYPASGVDPASLRLQLNPLDLNPSQSLEVGSWQPVVYNASNGTWSIDYVLPSDVTDLPPSAFYGALLSAGDKVGNSTVAASLRIRVDARPPVATLTTSDVTGNQLSASITNPVSIGGTILDPLIGTDIDDINFQPNDKMEISFAPITQVLPYSGTVLQLNFEDRIGSATFADSSDQVNRAFCTGRCPQLGVAGKRGNGLQIAANSSLSIIKDHPALNFPRFPATGSAQSFSVQGWVKVGAETSVGLVLLEKSSNRGGYSLGIADGQGRAYWRVTPYTGGLPTAVTLTGNRDLRDGQWHHLVGVYDRQQQLAMLYVDGLPAGSAAAANGDYGDLLERRDLNFGYSFSGRAATIDQIAVWNRALTTADIQVLYRTVDKLWHPATVVPRTVVGNPATWSLAVPSNLEGMIQIDGRATDIFGNQGSVNNLWRGIIDVIAPRVTISGTATGQSVLDANNVRQYEVKYTCLASDWQLDESKFNCPGNAIQPASRGFNTDPILQTQFPTLTILSTLSNTWTVWQPSNIPNGTLTACDATGKCSTATLGGAVAASGRSQVAGEELATGEAFSVAAAEVAAVPSEQPNAEIVNPTDGSFVGSAGTVEVTVYAEAARTLREVTVLLDGDSVATIPFARIDKITVAQQSLSIAMGAGEHSLEARATDWAGATQPAGTAVQFTLVTKEPTVALAKTKLTISDTYQAQSGIVLIQGTVDTSENLATVQVKVGDQPYADALVKDGVWGIAYPVSDPENRHLPISVRAIDKAGNITKIGEEATTDFADGVMPETSITVQPGNGVDATIGFTGTIGNQSATAFECKLDEAAFVPCTTPVEYKELSNGEHTFQVHAINGQGAQDSTPAEVKWTVNGGGIEAQIGNKPAAETSSRSARFELRGGSEYECSLDGATFTACSSPAIYSNLSDGTHSFQVRVKGNPASQYNWRVINEAPVASSMVVTAEQNVKLHLLLRASDESALRYIIVNQPANGSLSGDAPSLTYQPATDFFGTDSFSFKADDGDATSNVATVTINVTPTPGQGGLQRDGFVVYGQEGVILREAVKVMSGDIAASLSSPGPWLGDGAEVSIGKQTTFADRKSKVFADTLFVGQGTILHDANFNELRGPGKVSGAVVSPQPLPLLNRFVAMPAIGIGKQNVDVATAASATLTAGSYRSLNVAQGGEVIFSGGLYSFSEWNVAANSKLYFAAASEIRISGRAIVGEHGYVGPAPSSAVTAKQIVIYVAGVNANIGNLGGLGAKAATFGPYATLAANVVVPNGTLLIRERSKAVGSFVGRWVSVGKFSELTLANRFNSNTVEGRVAGYTNLTLDDVAGINATTPLSAEVDDELRTEEGANETVPTAGQPSRLFLPIISAGASGQANSQSVDAAPQAEAPQAEQSANPEGETRFLFLPVVSR